MQLQIKEQISSLFNEHGYFGDLHFKEIDSRFIMSAVGALFILSHYFNKPELFLTPDEQNTIFNILIKMIN